MARVQCPNCGSLDTTAGVGDISNCLNCGKTFDSKGNLVQGPDQETKDIQMARLEKTYEPSLVGNLADLQRSGGGESLGTEPVGDATEATLEAKAAEREAAAAKPAKSSTAEKASSTPSSK